MPLPTAPPTDPIRQYHNSHFIAGFNSGFHQGVKGCSKTHQCCALFKGVDSGKITALRPGNGNVLGIAAGMMANHFSIRAKLFHYPKSNNGTDRKLADKCKRHSVSSYIRCPFASFSTIPATSCPSVSGVNQPEKCLLLMCVWSG